MIFHALSTLAVEVPGTWIALFVFAATLPFLIWFSLYAASRRRSANTKLFLLLLRVMRWSGWVVGVAFALEHLRHENFNLFYAYVCGMFSLGLSFPESWIKRQITPDAVDTEDWWPTKPEQK